MKLGLDGLNFVEYSAARKALAASGRLLDMGEHNLYASLRQSHPGRFDPIAPSADPKSQYRCHVAELFVERWGMPFAEKARASVCEGVRAALGAVFSMLAAQGRSILIPSDVYPEYLALAKRSGVRSAGYEARRGAPSAEDLAGVDAALVCDPLKPWGGSLGEAEASRLSAWAMARPEERLLVADCAYGIDDQGAGKIWRDDRSALVLSSISKGWLAPRRAGCAVAPDAWVERVRTAIGSLPKNEDGLRQAYACLLAHPGRPAEVALAVGELVASSTLRLGGDAKPLAPAGYFCRSEEPADEWLRRGVLAIPASVFGSSERSSFLSVLTPVVPSGAARG